MYLRWPGVWIVVWYVEVGWVHTHEAYQQGTHHRQHYLGIGWDHYLSSHQHEMIVCGRLVGILLDEQWKIEPCRRDLLGKTINLEVELIKELLPLLMFDGWWIAWHLCVHCRHWKPQWERSSWVVPRRWRLKTGRWQREEGWVWCTRLLSPGCLNTIKMLSSNVAGHQ